MPEKKEEQPTSIKFRPGLKRDIKKWAWEHGDLSFSDAVGQLLDLGLYHSSYKFPFAKPEFTTNHDENEG